MFYLLLRERKRGSGEWAESQRKARNPKQAPGSELSAHSPTRGSNPRTGRSWPEQKSDAQPMEPPRCPSTCMFLWAHRFAVHLVKYQKVWLLDRMVRAHLVFWEATKLFSRAAGQFGFPASSECESLLLHILTSIWSRPCFGFWSFSWVVVSHCFNLSLPNGVEYLSMVICHLDTFLV